uniref:Ribosomal RNA methyltransferase FtsJ domain-containing protein n=1 Tax=viral metagenome TaxID=1070528 RepID=A0A6C0I9U5_9ZZZZ
MEFFNNENNNIKFENEVPFRYLQFSNLNCLKNKEYGNFEILDSTKCKIDTLNKIDERYRKAATRYLHEYELIRFFCKKSVISRAYFKMYEMIYSSELIKKINLNCFFICEAPGGFIEAVSDIRRKQNLKTDYISISKQSEIKYNYYLEQNNLLDGDITNVSVIDNTIKTVLNKFPDKLDLITADGGFDVKIFNGQEIITNHLLLAEIYLALSTQKINGTFIIKFFDMFTHNSIVMYMLLSNCYKYIKIIKPNTSVKCNSERYLICESFLGIGNKMLDDLYNILDKYIYCSPKDTFGIYTIIYPNINPNINLGNLDNLKKFNNSILQIQVEFINESIKMVENKNKFLQSIFFKIFIDKITTDYIFFYKNILNSRIRKCISFLKKHNINTNQYGRSYM